jgi:hypothetical protein
MPDKTQLEKARTIADQVIRRALADPRFREELKTDPRAVLEKAGLSAGSAEEAAREMKIDGHKGVIDCDSTCNWGSCLFTCFYTDDK